MRLKSLSITGLAIGLIPATAAAALDIRQTEHTYHMAVTRDVTRPAFVIGDFSTRRSPAAPAIAQRSVLPSLTIRVTGQPMPAAGFGSANCVMPVVHFPLGSADPHDFGRETITALQACGISDATQLLVTGYTCDLGPVEFNLDLARRRAERVAALLAGQGYDQVEIEAAGATRFITHDPARRHLNRRVEIQNQEFK
ncbi:hypothetical protein ACHHRT_01555 [Desulfurivibrio sp. D14AmB]|uniref:hypothetical protein n=1 Tax=Desulfurivibrio sp. D14AmB TaxID=3374370 RepID=UPI00376F0BF7